MAGVLAPKQPFYRPLLIIPLLLGTIWFLVMFQRSYEPLMKFIALRSLHREDPSSGHDILQGREVDEDGETGLRFVNPSLIIPLEEMWVAKKPADGSVSSTAENGEDNI